MNSSVYIKAYNELSEIQKEATNSISDPLLVLAGPGSGKTRVLTCHIAKIIDTYSNENFRVLGLTFTNKAADEMRNRLINFIPKQEGRLFIGTFHSFCADILRQHGIHLNINPNFNIYSLDIDQKAILDKAIQNIKNHLDYDLDTLRKSLPVIRRLKSRLILPEDSRKEFKDERIGQVISKVYHAYEAQLLKENALDFDSLILKAYQLFTNFPTFAKRYRAVYPYICIDEFQDSNSAQYGFIRALTGKEHRNIFVVADDDQIIYQWNGASYKRINQFIDDFSPTIIQLPMNYRCPSEIVRLANNLIVHNKLRTPDKKPIEAFHTDQVKGTVRLLPAFTDFSTEAHEIANDIRELHSEHPGSVVILGRSRKILESIEEALIAINIPAVISQRKDEFKSTPLVWLHSILRLANDRQNQDYLQAVCGTFTQLTNFEIDTDRIIADADASNKDYLQQWIKYINSQNTDKSVKETIKTVSECFSEGRNWFNFNSYALNWFNELITEKQQMNQDPNVELFFRYEEERSVWEDLIRDITDALGEGITLEALLQELQMHSKESFVKKNTVRIMTIHGAKGKEFHHVYLVGLVEDELPSYQSKQKGNDSPEMEEERRNCFVAITRTIKSLTLSYSEKYRGWPKEPSRFLIEMGLIEKQ